MEQAVKKFIDFTDFTFIPSEDKNVHIFRVKPGDEAVMKLLETGFFDGTEKFIRRTSIKGYGDNCSNHIYTVIHNNGDSYSWEETSAGTTCISEKTRLAQKIIDGAIALLLY